MESKEKEVSVRETPSWRSNSTGLILIYLLAMGPRVAAILGPPTQKFIPALS